MSVLARTSAALALTLLSLGCTPDSPLRPFAVQDPNPGASDSTSRQAAVKTFRLQVGWTAEFEMGGRQYQRFVRYESSDSLVAKVSVTGVIRAIAPGSATITASFGTNTAQAEVIVTAAPSGSPEVTSFGISPKFGVSISAGASRQFTALATWSDNVSRDIGVTYSANGGTVSSMGLYSAGTTAGVYLVVATCVCGLADTAFVHVGGGASQLATLRISPKAVTLEPGASQLFTSKATWSTGDTTPPPRSYSATGGTIGATGAYVAPSSSGTYLIVVAHVGGTLRDTAVVTVSTTGSDPETPPPIGGPPAVSGPGWMIHQDFEGGVLGTTPPGFFGGAPPRSGTQYSGEQTRSGNRSARLSIAEGTDGWGHFGGVISFPEHVRKGETVRVRASFWMPVGFEPNQRNGEALKFLRVHTADSRGTHVGYHDVLFNRMPDLAIGAYVWGYEGGGYVNYVRPFGASQPFAKERWETFEWAITMDNVPVAEGGSARVLMWKNGTLMVDIRDARTLTDAGGFATRFLLFTFWNGLAQKDTHIFLDDLTITNRMPLNKDKSGNPFLGY